MRRGGRLRVGVVAEIGLYRDALADALRRRGLEVLSSVGTAADAAAELNRLRPDVVLVDVARSGGPALLSELAAAVPELRLVAMGVRDVDRDVLACIEAGATGYVVRDASLKELAAAAHQVGRGEPLASPHVIATLMRRVAVLSANGNRVPFAELTKRELEIVELLEKGLSNKEIAAQLSIAVTTVKNHVHRILEKLNVQRRGEAASLVRASAPKR
jgi:two-component system nitrate/nitrite response regulator NarL